jgi:hypothetical protein
MVHGYHEAVARQRRAEEARQAAWISQALKSRPGRQVSAPAPPSSEKHASDSLGASKPLPDPDAYCGPDIAPARSKPAPERKAVQAINPDWQGRLEANVRRRRQLALGVQNEGADDGRVYAVTESGARFLTSRRARSAIR